MIHPEFKLNGQSFSTVQALEDFARNWTLVSGENRLIGEFILEWLNTDDFIQVKTSGSTGTPKLMTLQKQHVQNSARATVDYFQLFENTKALLCMSSEYIAGKMMLVRAMTAGWDLYAVEPTKNPLKNATTEFDFTAMVPYQVFHAIDDLHKVKKIIIGGGVIPQKLENQLQAIDTLAFATYGMTETISHIAARAVNGKQRSTVFTALPHVEFSQTPEGCLKISAPFIAEEIQVTNDVVELISPTEFRFLGRIDNVINTGGVKMYPEAIEQKLSAFIEKPFFIASEKDDALGERIILVVEDKTELNFSHFSEAFESLSAYERPKKIYTLPNFIYTDTEKIKRIEVLQLIQNMK